MVLKQTEISIYILHNYEKMLFVVYMLIEREKFNDKVTPNYNKKTPVHYVYLYTSWPVNARVF